MSRVRFIEHRGVPILYLDFSEVQNPEEGLAAINEAKGVIREQPPGSVRTLTNVTGSRFDSRLLSALKALAVHNKPYVRAGAVVGVTGLLRIAYNAVMTFSGRNLPVFDDVESARDWLARQ
ncbi:MAG TPA: hypothetical protein VNK43_01955 [Gemmatimonadales bacterium]|nr:hypothetical protein [Gemmatimonadales bacterium]